MNKVRKLALAALMATFGLAVASAIAQDAGKDASNDTGNNTGRNTSVYLEGPIKFGRPGENPLTPEELVRLNASRIDTEAGQPDENEFVDLAYGAFQRGYYLSAFKLALPRAESGEPAAQTLLAELYDRGLGVARDQKKAAIWYRFAAKTGNREAQLPMQIFWPRAR